MNLDRVEKIAEAVLYEGYMLYPYRASAVKNQRRWNFGVVCPQAYAESQNGSEAWSMQTECLLQGDRRAQLQVKIHFLQIVKRSIGRIAHPASELPEDGPREFQVVERLEMGGHTYVPWQEAVEREIVVAPLHTAVDSAHEPLMF